MQCQQAPPVILLPRPSLPALSILPPPHSPRPPPFSHLTDGRTGSCRSSLDGSKLHIRNESRSLQPRPKNAARLFCARRLCTSHDRQKRIPHTRLTTSSECGRLWQEVCFCESAALALSQFFGDGTEQQISREEFETRRGGEKERQTHVAQDSAANFSSTVFFNVQPDIHLNCFLPASAPSISSSIHLLFHLHSLIPFFLFFRLLILT